MYGCDCDGVKREPLDRGIEGDALRASLGMIERIAGHRPPTCPWRAFSDPITQDVLEVAWAKGGSLASAVGADADHKLMQAMGVYRRAVAMTRAEDQRIERQKREAEAARRKAVGARHG